MQKLIEIILNDPAQRRPEQAETIAAESLPLEPWLNE